LSVRQIPLPIGPAPLHSFDGFVAGANAAALAQLRDLARSLTQEQARGLPPIYLWGPPGSGKTHLLRALVAAVQAGGHRAAWFDAATAPPWSLDEAWSVAVLDDCDAYAADQQQAAFTLFIEAGSQGLPIVAAGALPPTDLGLRDDLRTRLGWGHVHALQVLTESETRAALRREADRRGIFLSDEVMDYLLTRFSRDLAHLLALLERLDEFALSQHRAVTVPLLKRMFEQEGAAL
jgi:DnaA family protein